MSHIDSFKHQIVGLFGCLPVYRPLETMDGDFFCDTHQLVLGGGSGEHPAMVLKNPEAAAAWFLYEGIPYLDIPEEEKEAWRDKVLEFVTWHVEEILAFYEWDIKTYHDFYELCSSPSMNSRYDEDESSFEAWLIMGFGEFIYYSMPHLAKKVIATSKTPYKHMFHTQYNNILLIPPNFPVYSNGGNAFKSELVNDDK